MKPGDAEASWQKAIDGRDEQRGDVRVVELEESAIYPPYVLPGTLLVVVAEPGDETLLQVSDLAKSSTWRDLSVALFDVEEDLLGDLGASEPSDFSECPVLGELSYGETTLTRGLGLPGSRPHAALLMYAGGSLRQDSLKLKVFPIDSGSLEAVIIANPPELSEVERKIVAQVEDDPAAMTLAEPAFWPVVAKEAGKFIVTYLTGKGVDRWVDAERDAAGRRERAERLAERVGRENARRRYRNAELSPDDTLLNRLELADTEIDAAQATRELLEARREILRRALEDPPSDSED